jgi:SAM-dependent methyltransferase
MSKSDLKKIEHCEVCGSNHLTDVLNLGMHPMCDDLVPINDSRICKEYPIEILFCKQCCTAHQKYQIPKNELFPNSYHYRSRFTADVLNGMEDLVSSCVDEFGNLENKKVLDIGCNDGSLLDIFQRNGALTYGIEPTGAYEDAVKKGHNVVNEFFTVEISKNFAALNGTFDFICFTNVFAHIEDLNGVLDALRFVINPSTIIVIENHYLGSVLEGTQFDTFYHEHPRTYSYQSFVHIAKSLGLSLLNVQFPSRYGGNIRVYIGSDDFYKLTTPPDLIEKENGFFREFISLNEKIDSWKISKKEFVKKHNTSNGKLIGKAFPGRAAILIKLLELNENDIEAVYEKPGSMKIGHYIPGTRIPIKSDFELFSNQNKNALILNLAWHIGKEIENYLRSNGLNGEIINILNKEDLGI